MKYDFDTLVSREGTNSSKWRMKGDVLPMWVADMDFKAAPEILKCLAKNALITASLATLSSQKSGTRLSKNGGKGAINVSFENEWISFCTGVIPAISTAIRRFSNPGDQILVQAPVYHVFFNCIKKQRP